MDFKCQWLDIPTKKKTAKTIDKHSSNNKRRAKYKHIHTRALSYNQSITTGDNKRTYNKHNDKDKGAEAEADADADIEAGQRTSIYFNLLRANAYLN